MVHLRTFYITTFEIYARKQPEWPFITGSKPEDSISDWL